MRRIAYLIICCFIYLASYASGNSRTERDSFFRLDSNSENSVNGISRQSTSSDDHWEVISTISNCFDENNIGAESYQMTADGSTQLKVTLKYNGSDSKYTISAQDVKFYFYDGDDLFNDDNKELITDTDLYVGKYTTDFTDKNASVTITAPSKYPYTRDSKYEYFVVIKVKFKNGGTASVAKNIGIYRPGVIILHGLNDSAATFKTMKNYLVASGAYTAPQIMTMDYKKTNTSSFHANTHENKVVEKGLKELSSNLMKSGIASCKYDMIGHSMGGILERLYVQEVDDQHTNKLITLNTPHFGAPLGNVAPYLFTMLDILPPNIVSILANTFFNPTGGRKAVSDLAIGSAAINNLNSASASRLRGIPVFAVGTYINPDEIQNTARYVIPNLMSVEASFLLAHLFYKDIPSNPYTYLLTDDIWGDGIVSISSQQGGLPEKYYSIFNGPFSGAFHCNSPKWSTTLNELRLLLLSDPDNELFSFSGFGTVPKSSERQYAPAMPEVVTDFAEPRPESYINISANFDETDKSLCNSKISFSNDMSTTMVFAFLSPDQMIASYDDPNPVMQLGEDCETVTLYAIGRTKYNALVSSSTTITRNTNRIATVNDDADINCRIEGDCLEVQTPYDNYRIEIYNLTGHKIFTGDRNVDNRYDLSGINGVVIINVVSDNGRKTFKIIK